MNTLANPEPAAGKRDYLRDWLSMTTCSAAAVKRSVLFESDEYIVLKHNSHSSYTGRASGSMNCPSYAVLYRKADIEAQLYHFQYGSPRLVPLKRWNARINVSRVRAECLDIGVEFPASGTTRPV